MFRLLLHILKGDIYDKIKYFFFLGEERHPSFRLCSICTYSDTVASSCILKKGLSDEEDIRCALVFSKEKKEACLIRP